MWQVLDYWGPGLLVSPINTKLCLAIGVQSVWMVPCLKFSPLPSDAQLSDHAVCETVVVTNLSVAI